MDRRSVLKGAVGPVAGYRAVGPNPPSTTTYVCCALDAAQPATRICSSVTSEPLEPCWRVRDQPYAAAGPADPTFTAPDTPTAAARPGDSHACER